jgi:hypothetical protein
MPILQGWVTIFFGSVLVAAACAPRLLSGSYERSDGLTYLVSFGTLITALGIVRLVSGGADGLKLGGLGEYAKGLGVLGLYLAATYLLLFVITRFGSVTLLEVTRAFWLALLLCGVLVAWVLLHGLREKQHVPLFMVLREGVIGLMRDRVRGVTTTMMVTLVLAGVQGVALWVIVIAPSAYSNTWALSAIRTAASREDFEHNRFNANLVVTGALLKETDCAPPETTLQAGGLYMCFEGGPGCSTATGRNWRVFRKPNAARALDAVFASGSPFPVFPQHLARTPEGCKVRLIDGGYAHNIPLDAAKGLGARQVLIINASPEEVASTDSGFQLTSQLFRESPRLLSFMFDRAQAFDRSAGGSLLVASLGPKPHSEWPSLLDFHRTARDLVRSEAHKDIANRSRIGRIVNWGLPVFVEVRRPE